MSVGIGRNAGIAMALAPNGARSALHAKGLAGAISATGGDIGLKTLPGRRITNPAHGPLFPPTPKETPREAGPSSEQGRPGGRGRPTRRERDWYSIRLAVHSGATSTGRKTMSTPKAKLAGLALIAALCAGFTLGLTVPASAGYDEGAAALTRH